MIEDTTKYTRLFEAVGSTMEYDIDFTGDERIIVLVHDGEMRATGLFGFEQEGDAVGDLIGHLQAIFEANGRALRFIPIAGEG